MTTSFITKDIEYFIVSSSINIVIKLEARLIKKLTLSTLKMRAEAKKYFSLKQNFNKNGAKLDLR